MTDFPQSWATIDPTLGLDSGVNGFREPSPYHTVNTFNWVLDGSNRWIIPRSGLTSFLGNSATTFVNGGAEVFDIVGNPYVLGLSVSSQVMYCTPSVSTSFSRLSYVGSNPPAGTYDDSWGIAQAYDNAQDQIIAVWTNGVNLPKYTTVKSITTNYSDFTGTSSLLSKAKDLTNFDNRLVWFNISTSSLSYPNRVLWSTRGAATDYTLVNGAGFEDLFDMHGIGQKIIAEEDRIVLFTDEQIWEGRKRQDAYVFDFRAIRRDLGCPFPRTIVKTPYGICFLGRDLEVYTLMGDQVTSLSLSPQRDHSRTKTLLETFIKNSNRTWAVYDSRNRRYQLHFVYTGGVDPYGATFAIWHCFDNNSWWFEQWPATPLTYGLSVGVGNFSNTTFSQNNSIYFNSNGSIYKSNQTWRSDDSYAFQCGLWPGYVGFNRPDWTRLSEIWIGYNNFTSSTTTMAGTAYLYTDITTSDTFAINFPPSSSPAGKEVFIPCNLEGPCPQFWLVTESGTNTGIAGIDSIAILRQRRDRMYGGM